MTWPRPLQAVLSLRTIVIVAALSVVLLVILLGTWVWVGVTNDQYSQLDRRLDSVSSLGDISSLLRSGQDRDEDLPPPDGSVVRTARIAGIRRALMASTRPALSDPASLRSSI